MSINGLLKPGPVKIGFWNFVVKILPNLILSLKVLPESKMVTRQKKEEDATAKSNQKKLLEFMQAYQEEKREDDLNLLTAIEKQVHGVLRELQYIAELLGTNKNIAPVENIREKIKAAYEKIKAYLNSEPTEPSATAEGNRRTAGGIQVEQNPLIKEMGGMPLETISAEWRELVEGTVLDKSELENLINNKLKNRAELANKLTNKLKLQNKLAQQPKVKVGQQITPKFKKIQETLKYILKEVPPPPKPIHTITPPRPPGM